MKDDYKKLSKEWGSKRRKQDSRAAKSTLKRLTREERAELAVEKAFQEAQRRSQNPPDTCDRCGMPVDEGTRTWDGDRWMCDGCSEDTQQ